MVVQVILELDLEPLLLLLLRVTSFGDVLGRTLAAVASIGRPGAAAAADAGADAGADDAAAADAATSAAASTAAAAAAGIRAAGAARDENIVLVGHCHKTSSGLSRWTVDVNSVGGRRDRLIQRDDCRQSMKRFDRLDVEATSEKKVSC